MPAFEYPMDQRDRELWAMYFRRYEPAVSDFIDHLETYNGKLTDAQVRDLLTPVLKVLIIGDKVKLGPNFKDVT